MSSTTTTKRGYRRTTTTSFLVSLSCILLLLLLILLTTIPSSDAKTRRRGSAAHKRLRNSILPFSRGGRGSSSRHRGPRLLRGSESKNVFFYSIPKAPPPKPRIILGDELNFSELGIASSSSRHHHHPKNLLLPTSSLTALEHQLIEQSINAPYDNNNNHVVAFKHQLPPRQRGKKSSRTPSSRSPSIPSMDIDYYDDDNASPPIIPPREPRRQKQQHQLQRRPSKPPGGGGGGGDFSVMGSMYRAAGELRNAYKAAIVQSAQVAKLTTHAASKYLKGVRNIFGGSGENAYHHRPSTRGPGYRLRNRGDGDHHDDESFTTALSGTSLELPGSTINEQYDDGDDEGATGGGGATRVKGSSSAASVSHSPDRDESNPSSPLPKLHLDVGGSFWPLFYKRSKMHGSSKTKIGQGSLSEAEGRVDSRK